MSDTDPLAADYARCFETPEGQRVLADLMTVCGVYDAFVGTDPVQMALATGARNVALHIAAKLNYKPGDFARRAEQDEWMLDNAYNYGNPQ